MAVIYINNDPYEVQEGRSLLEVCLSLGFDIPYFCWHPAMHSVGACRQCAVKQFKDKDDKHGFIVMSCVTGTEDGMRISIDDPEVIEFRRGIIELLMTNHPHDCPVCDEGGECHLQDMTVMTGHVERHFRFKKRTYRNQNLGPFINHELNRCIQCYRCVRFYKDYAGGRDFDVFGIHNRIYFGRDKDGKLESEFSGNLVEVCPTGVFTDTTQYRHYTRKWDLQTAPSVCVHCSVGCDIIPGERYGTLRRIRNRYNHHVNGYFLCDRGRYGYEFINREDRIRSPLLVNNGKAAPIPEEAAYSQVSVLLSTGKTIGIGSPRASLESNFALKRLVGNDNFYAGISSSEFELTTLVIEIIKNSGLQIATLREMSESDAALIIGEDVSNTAPMMALALRQSIHQKRYEYTDKLGVPRWNALAVKQAGEFDQGPFYLATAGNTRLDGIATAAFKGTPDEIASLGSTTAKLIDGGGESEKIKKHHEFASKMAKDLENAARPVIVTGISQGSAEILKAAVNLALTLKSKGAGAKLAIVLPECNSLGLGLLGGKGGLDDALNLLRSGEAQNVLILENDIFRRIPTDVAEEALSGAKVVVLDHSPTATTDKADLVLPVGTYADCDGTLVNYESRTQRFFQVMSPSPGAVEPWRRLAAIAEALNTYDANSFPGRDSLTQWTNFDDVLATLVEEYPVFRPILDIAPPAAYRIAGMKVARQTHRYSGRTSIAANLNIHEQQPPEDVDAPFNFSMEGYHGEPPSSLIPRYWAPRWNSVQSLNKFQAEVGGKLIGGDPGRRLLKPKLNAGMQRYEIELKSFEPKEGAWFIMPIYEVFGSEELSAKSPPILSVTPKPYLVLSAKDAESLELENDSPLVLKIDGSEYNLKTKIELGVTDGTALLSVGLPGMKYVNLPSWGKIEKSFF